MQKILCLFLLFSTFVVAQNTFTIKGKVVDKTTQTPLESATFYMTKVKDSTVIDYSITDANGAFIVERKAVNEPFILRVSYTGFLPFSKKMEGLSANLDLGTLQLEEDVEMLNTIDLKGEIPPIVIKKDTLEFNASSFKVRPDANVEALLKELPGVEIDSEGKIKVNGKEVNNILVNGKPFFGKDGKVATQNLPAELIEKVQVTDTKTKTEELSGDGASGNESTINLTISEEDNKGLFGKVLGGLGTNDRYESSFLLNYFEQDLQLSLLGSANNINSVGFSMDEIFDNMGGGRSTSMWSNGSGGFGINGMQFGGGKGITTSEMIGFNYGDSWFNKKVDPHLSYYFSHRNSENVNRTESINLLPTGETRTVAGATSNDVSFGHQFNTEFDIKIDSTLTIFMAPKMVNNKSKSTYKSNRNTFDESNSLLNSSASDNFSESKETSISNDLNLYKNLAKEDRGISFDFDFDVSQQTTDDFVNSSTDFIQSGDPSDVRNQKEAADIAKSNYNIKLYYKEPLTDSISLGIEMAYVTNTNENSLNTKRFNAVSNTFDIDNDAQSNSFLSKESRLLPGFGIQIKKKKYRGGFTALANVIALDNSAVYLGQNYELNQNYVFPKLSGYFRYTLKKNMSLYTNLNFDVNMPSARQLLPVLDLRNPLNTVIGNTSLVPTKTVRMYAGLNNYDWKNRSGMNTYFGFTNNYDAVVSSTVYDSDFKSNTSYVNVANNFSSYAGTYFSKSFKKEKRTFGVEAGVWGNYNVNNGFVNGSAFKAATISIDPDVEFTWSIEELITVTPSYTFEYNKTSFTNYFIDETDFFRHNAKMEITTYWPKKVVFGSDFGYTYNSNIADGFKKDFYLWNLSLGYQFYEDKFTAKVKMYDVLNQNIGTRRTVSPTGITDTEDTVLQQYLMFSLSYKLEKFGGKKKSDWD